MIPTVHPDEPHDPEYRNGAHLGPAFLPWHREMLMQLELDLQSLDESVTLPYWDWTEDAADPLNSPIWSSQWMGGDGDKNDHDRVKTGPFAYQNGKWPVPAYPENGETEPGLKRQFGQRVTSLPTPADLAMAMREWLYDTPPYDAGPYTRGFRNRLEGWVTQRGDPQVTTPGSQLHNRVHLWIGGNMLAMTSPEDPVFFCTTALSTRSGRIGRHRCKSTILTGLHITHRCPAGRRVTTMTIRSSPGRGG